MSRRKVKAGRSGQPRLRGHKQTAGRDQWERGSAQRLLQEQARRRRMTRVDGETGEEYILARLALIGKDVDGYRQGLTSAVAQVPQEAAAQAEAIRSYLQGMFEQKKLAPIPCRPGEKPTCRVYLGVKRRVVVIRQDDPEAGGIA